MALDDTTAISLKYVIGGVSAILGFLGVSVSGIFAYIYKFAAGMRREVDKHDGQITEIEKWVETSKGFDNKIIEHINSINITMASIETKLDLLIRKKIK